MSRRRDLDEDDVRVRPGRTKSRPRSKERPGHQAARPGMVIAVDRGRCTVLLDDPRADRAPGADPVTVTAVKARELGRRGVVVGDRVRLVGDLRGHPDALARVVRVDRRGTVLRRSADDTDPVERVVVANADQLGVVVSLAEPPPRTGLVDRALVAAYDAGLQPLLVLTKDDLADPQPLLVRYEPLDVPAVVVHRGGDLQPLRGRLHDRVTVLLGHSGVGKSTLVNALVPGADRSTGAVNAVTGRGRHTSTSAVCLPLPGGGWIIDTPGIRSFGLAHVRPDRVIHAFPDLGAGTADCPRACSHDEPDCALDDYVRSGAAGPGGPARLASLRRLLRSVREPG